MNIYIDESGNLGKGGRYFVIAAVVPHKPKRLKNLVRHACVRFGITKPLPELKGSKLSFAQKQDFFNRLTSFRDFDVAYLVADKLKLNQVLLRNQNICFNYLTGMMLKSLMKNVNEDVHIMCDNRNIKVSAGRSLCEYLQVEAYSKWGFGHVIDLRYAESHQQGHLQVVDLVANAVFARYERRKGHFYTILRPHLKYGIRFPYQTFGQ